MNYIKKGLYRRVSDLHVMKKVKGIFHKEQRATPQFPSLKSVDLATPQFTFPELKVKPKVKQKEDPNEIIHSIVKNVNSVPETKKQDRSSIVRVNNNVETSLFFERVERLLTSNLSEEQIKSIMEKDLFGKMKEFHLKKDAGEPLLFDNIDLQNHIASTMEQLKNLESDWKEKTADLVNMQEIILSKEKEMAKHLSDLKSAMVQFNQFEKNSLMMAALNASESSISSNDSGIMKNDISSPWAEDLPLSDNHISTGALTSVSAVSLSADASTSLSEVVPVSMSVGVPVLSSMDVPASMSADVPTSLSEVVPVSLSVGVPVLSSMDVPASMSADVPTSLSVGVPVSMSVDVPVLSSIDVPTSMPADKSLSYSWDGWTVIDSVVPSGTEFVFKNGLTVCTIKDFKKAIMHCDEDVLNFHINKHENHFAPWFMYFSPDLWRVVSTMQSKEELILFFKNLNVS